MAEKKQQKHSLAWWVFWAVMFDLFVIGLIIPSSSIDRMRSSERLLAERGLGASTARWADVTGSGWYYTLFEDSGLRREVQKLLVPSEEERRRSRGLENLGQGFWFPYVNARIHVIFSMLQQGCIRLAVALAWSPFFVAVIVPAMWDGMMDWRRRQYSFAYASPIMHGFGLRLVTYMPVLILVLTIAPFPLPVFAFPLLAAVAGFGVNLVGRHTQKRV